MVGRQRPMDAPDRRGGSAGRHCAAFALAAAMIFFWGRSGHGEPPTNKRQLTMCCQPAPCLWDESARSGNVTVLLLARQSPPMGLPRAGFYANGPP